VTNIGVRPTFELEPVPVRLEAHLLDYDGDLYGQQLKLEFIERLRDELRFISRNELVEQIRLDIDQARSIIERV
jgi:riboflavin kinase/FMN adenylyltransferase